MTINLNELKVGSQVVLSEQFYTDNTRPIRPGSWAYIMSQLMDKYGFLVVEEIIPNSHDIVFAGDTKWVMAPNWLDWYNPTCWEDIVKEMGIEETSDGFEVGNLRKVRGTDKNTWVDLLAGKHFHQYAMILPQDIPKLVAVLMLIKERLDNEI